MTQVFWNLKLINKMTNTYQPVKTIEKPETNTVKIWMKYSFFFCSTVWLCMCENTETALVFFLLTLHYPNMHSLETMDVHLHLFTHSAHLWLGCAQIRHIRSGADPSPDLLLDLLHDFIFLWPSLHSLFICTLRTRQMSTCTIGIWWHSFAAWTGLSASPPLDHPPPWKLHYK